MSTRSAQGEGEAISRQPDGPRHRPQDCRAVRRRNRPRPHHRLERPHGRFRGGPFAAEPSRSRMPSPTMRAQPPSSAEATLFPPCTKPAWQEQHHAHLHRRRRLPGIPGRQEAARRRSSQQEVINVWSASMFVRRHKRLTTTDRGHNELMARKKLIAANWKMYKTPTRPREFFRAFLPLVEGTLATKSRSARPSSTLPRQLKRAKDPASASAPRICSGKKKAPTRAKSPPACSSPRAARTSSSATPSAASISAKPTTLLTASSRSRWTPD